MANSRKTHACTRKVIPIIQEAAASGGHWASEAWNPEKLNCAFGIFYCLKIENMHGIKPPNKIETSRQTALVSLA